MTIFLYGSIFYSLVFFYLILNQIQILNFNTFVFLFFMILILNIKIMNNCSLVQYLLSIFGVPSLTSFSYFILLVLSQFGVITWCFGTKEKIFMMILLSLFYMNYSNLLWENLFYLSPKEMGLWCLFITFIAFLINNILGFMFLFIIIFHQLFLPLSYNLFLCFLILYCFFGYF